MSDSIQMLPALKIDAVRWKKRVHLPGIRYMQKHVCRCCMRNAPFILSDMTDNLHQRQLPAFLRNHLLLLTIMAVAAVTRFYNLSGIPYTHDELSALLRTRFDSFSELIAGGVKIDGHPALVQVFLYYWTGLFGQAEWVVKLPFILTGMGAVYFAYRIGKRWMNETSGLLAAAFLATSEYTVMYSQIARPYTSGLFLTLLMAYHWGEIVFFRNYKLRHLIWFPVAAALCAYNHHFSMFTAALIGIGGLFFVGRTFLLKYIGLCIGAFLLYAPHIPILLAQLKTGGIGGWLGKPEPSFVTDYFNYLTHFSLFLQLVLLITWLVLFFRSRKQPESRNYRTLLFSGLLFVTVIATGYFYSVYRAPVLQFSVLIFAFPFVVFFFFGWIRKQSAIVNTIAVLGLMLTQLFTLVVTRQYYKVFYVSVFEQLVKDANEALKSDPHTLTLLFTDEPKTRFYAGRLPIPSQHRFITWPEFTEKHLDSLLQSGNYDRVCLCGTSAMPVTFQALVQERYPHVVWQRDYFSAGSVLLARSRKYRKPTYDLFVPGKNSFFSGIVPEKLTATGYNFLQGDEWGPGIEIPLDKRFVQSPNDVIDVMVKVKVPGPDQDFSLVLLTQDKDSVFHYSEKQASEYVFNPTDSTYLIVQSLRLSDNKFAHFAQPVLKSFIWNKRKSPLLVKHFNVYYRRGNHYLYSLYEPIQ